jgi:Ca2+-binding RTX toxin-like protein
MTGGAIDTLYFVDNAGDVVIEGVNGGNDTISASVSYDNVANVENVVLTGSADIDTAGFAGQSERLRGNAGDNVILGRAGNDSIAGGDGADSLVGGDGNDTLTGGGSADTLAGGTGADRFQWIGLFASTDVVTGFSSIDILVFDATDYGLGTATGAMAATRFRARADNLAQDADDRFIFRTTDDTLWHDANGAAAGGLRQVLDFATDVTLTAADFLLV